MSCENSNGGNSNSSVKRSLFGNVDHDQIKDDLKRQLALISQEKRRKWNFDFENFRPLPPGRYIWERVGKRLEHVKLSSTSCETTSQFNVGSELANSPDLQQNKQRYNLRNRVSKGQIGSARVFKPIAPATPETRLREAVPLKRPLKQGGNVCFK